MAWLRIDDGFTEHPKLVTLTSAQRWEWLEILTWCARNRSGDITAGVVDGTRHSTRRRTTIGTALGRSAVQRLAAVKLIEQTEDGRWHVHDWDHYNGSDPRLLAKERKRRQRANSVTERDDDRDEQRDLNGTSRARSPVPSRPSDTKAAAGSTPEPDPTTEEPAAAWHILKTDLITIGWEPWQIAKAEVDQTRATTALDRAHRESNANPGGYAWRLFNTNGPIEKPTPKVATVNGSAAPYQAGNTLRYLAAVQAIYEQAPADEREIAARVWLEGFTGDQREIDAHLAELASHEPA